MLTIDFSDNSDDKLHVDVEQVIEQCAYINTVTYMLLSRICTDAGFVGLFMVALCNRETIYIFILFLSSSFFFLLFFPRLISAVED